MVPPPAAVPPDGVLAAGVPPMLPAVLLSAAGALTSPGICVIAGCPASVAPPGGASAGGAFAGGAFAGGLGAAMSIIVIMPWPSFAW